MKRDNHHTPTYRMLGRYLKTMRQRLQESLGETSGAVEIAVEQLDRFERGTELPSEDILMLLISHFGLADDEAVKLWELAGYERQDDRTAMSGGRADDMEADDGRMRQTVHVMLLALDNRVLYTNGVELAADHSGVVLNFMQGTDKTHGLPSQLANAGSSQANAVSRIGMSYDQVEQLMQTLQRALLHKRYLSGPKRLPPPAA